MPRQANPLAMKSVDDSPRAIRNEPRDLRAVVNSPTHARDAVEVVADLLELCPDCRTQIRATFARTHTTMEEVLRESLWRELHSWAHAHTGCPSPTNPPRPRQPMTLEGVSE